MGAHTKPFRSRELSPENGTHPFVAQCVSVGVQHFMSPVVFIPNFRKMYRSPALHTSL